MRRGIVGEGGSPGRCARVARGGVENRGETPRQFRGCRATMQHQTSFGFRDEV